MCSCYTSVTLDWFQSCALSYAYPLPRSALHTLGIMCPLLCLPLVSCTTSIAFLQSCALFYLAVSCMPACIRLQGELRDCSSTSSLNYDDDDLVELIIDKQN